ncbi:hypothetical protein FOL47_008474 [Perkinsus chesapeaki]|uniref:Fe2OG dioxygenase domain-containing protein n=1 Tax=Perkinsus chesapeaki TaxID=330153 RepID=A0A7J6LDT3_PERCH|nr:hypothetical protein FOL47_008474 [Perkinsus chesapeaki]
MALFALLTIISVTLAWRAPVVDLACFGDKPHDDCDGAEGALLLAASKTGGGAFILQGHGVDDSLIDNVFPSARRLFTAVDQLEKERLAITGGGLTRGYVLLGGESGSDRQEMKEAFSYGYDWHAEQSHFENKLQGPNVWPSGINTEDKRILNEWFEHATRIGLALSAAFARATGQEALASSCGPDGASISLQRVFRYFAVEGNDRSGEKRIGSSPHTDWGFITIVLQQEGIDGLEVQDPETGYYYPLPNDRPSRIVVNVGDFASIMTGGKLYSPVHRVMPPLNAAERLSLVHFYYPNYNTTLEGFLNTDAAKRTSLLSDQKEGGAAEWMNDEDAETMTFGDFISAKWGQVYRPVSSPAGVDDDEEL